MWDLKLLSDQNLRRLAGMSSFARGKLYAQQNRVHLLATHFDKAHFRVQGTRSYVVELAQHGDKLHYSCTCPLGREGIFCKHCVASALVLRMTLQKKQSTWHWQRQIRSILALPPAEFAAPAQPDDYLLIFLLEEEYTYYRTYLTIEPYWVPLKRLRKKYLLTEDEPLPATPEAWRAWIAQHARELRGLFKKRMPPGNTLVRAVNLPQEAPSVVRWMREVKKAAYGYTPEHLARTFMLMAQWHAPLYRSLNTLNAPITVVSENGETTLSLTRSPNGSLLLQGGLKVQGQTVPIRSVETITYQPTWLLINETTLVHIPTPGIEAWLTALEQPLQIPQKDAAKFRDLYLPRLIKQWGRPLEGDLIQYEHLTGLVPVPRLYLQEINKKLVAELRFAYGEHEVVYTPSPPPNEILQAPHDPWKFLVLPRDAEAEAAFHHEAATAKHGLKRGSKEEPALLQLRARVSPVDFLLDKVPKLAAAGFEIFGEEKLKNVRVNRHQPTLSVNITSGIDWFDVQAVVQFGDQIVSLGEIKRALRKRRRYVKLADGSIGRLPDEWLERYKRLFGLAEAEDEKTNTLRFADFHATLLETLAEEAEQAEADAAFRERLARLKNFHGIAERPLPAGLQGELRPYQIAGYHWLHFLHEYGFGGILADDMGLGKTVQVLAFLLSLRENGHAQAPDLIVVPRSLLINWQREVEKFTPGLKVLTYFGPQRPSTEIFADYDLILTTYGVMRVDNDILRAQPFHYIVLDESQAIKNPLAKTSRAARRLKSDHRLVMTGTPVENNTFELWAQFAFVMPGLLGSLDYFKEEFVKPIEKKQDEAVANALRRMVYPFILRRTKEQVAPELPPRTERVVYCPMEPAQRRFYIQLRDYYRDMLLGLIEEEGLDKSRMKILEGLLRLRQASIHPRLIDPDFRGESGKMEVLFNTLETLQSEGHKALVFSQFVGVLTLVREELDARGIPYAYLDGSTQDRQAQVDRFQNDPAVPFFLISLKAGGVGLNLTAADYVIHIDPWWNPAVERQASDRTHRIGQDKPVFIFKLITRESVEEKILQLQEKKKALVEKLVTTESSFLKELKPEDIKVLFG